MDGEGETANGVYTSNTYNLRTDSFRDMIIYYRNNPSILIWEIGNQIVPTNVSQTIIGYIQQYDHGNRTYTTANETGDYSYNSTETKTNVGSYQSTSNGADNVRMAAIRQGTDTAMVPYVDIGITTEGKTGMNNQRLGYKPEVEGEYNRLEARRGVWDIYTKGYSNFKNEVYLSSNTAYENVSSENFAVYQITSYTNMIDKSSHCGGGNWIFSDSVSHGRVKSEVSRASGEVDAVMLPKESYWVTKTIFSDTESAHIIGHWNYPTGTIKDVYVAANCKNATQAVLKVTDLNGRETIYTGTKSKKYLWTFLDVVYQEGTITVEVKNEQGTTLVSDSISSHGEPASLRITPIISPNGLLANGSDVLLLDVEILDSNGNRCKTFNGEVEENNSGGTGIYTYFTVNNQTNTQMEDNYCTWRGGYNSGIQYSINKKNLYLEAGITRVALRTTMQPGPITVTATTTLADGTALSDTCTVTSTSVNNINGYSEMLNARLQYSILQLNPTTIGTGEIPTEEDNTQTITFNSALVENISYTSNSTSEWRLEEVLENGATIYCDDTTTFNSIPYKYINAEYLKLPSADNGALALDLINFVASKNIDILVFRDETVEKPTWLANYTITNDIVTASNGQIYRVYKKSVTAGTGVTIGGNSNTEQTGAAGAMNIIAFKETIKVQNEVFFNEEFEDSIGATSYSGWTQIKGQDTDILLERLELETAIHFLDNSTASGEVNGKFAQIFKKFASQSEKLKLSYYIYISNRDTSITNRYIRLLLHNGPGLANSTLKDNFLMEVYIDEKTKLIYRTLADTDMNHPIATNIATDQWHLYEFEVDIKNNTFTTKIDNNPINGTFGLYGGLCTFANYVVIGSGANATNDFFVSNVSIDPIASDAITGIEVNGTEIPEFNVLTKDYLVKTNSSIDLHVDVKKRDENVTSVVTYSEDNNKADIVVVDNTNNTTLTYTIYCNSTYITKTELKSMISYANGLDGDFYTQATWNSLVSEINTAQEIVDSEDVNQNDVQSELNVLKLKIKSLSIDRNAIRNKYFN
ncbi:MAG: hypothetical protein Q4G09_06860 [Clostridia bacterium]|nr:hypothetical protein [Clostridia bacterium]